ncbi:Copine-domain-containing protein [Jimgerdemannia flammicorona]|uniref:Copine-domain-containing protein n=1 Tax=Jimgerdemannia flammicorona TaxID=994334 RepID=A0A433Q2P7_9FUNG|nr:Copine-domain-containing protein [Jimgerdemannia flammicorona]
MNSADHIDIPPVSPEPPQVSLHLSCANLAKRARIGSLNPLVILSTFDPTERQWIARAQTDVVENNENPVFSRPLTVDYSASLNTLLRFDVYDIDIYTMQRAFLADSDPSVKKQRLVGYMIVSLHTIADGIMCGLLTKDPNGVLCKCNSTWEDVVQSTRIRPECAEIMTAIRSCTTCGARLHNTSGILNIVGERTEDIAGVVTLQLEGIKLEKKHDHLFGKGNPDPFYVLSRTTREGAYVRVYKSEHRRNNVNVAWRRREVDIRDFCNGDLHAPIAIEVYDWNLDGAHHLIGVLNTCLADMIKARRWERLPLERRDDQIEIHHPPTASAPLLKRRSVNRSKKAKVPGFIKITDCSLDRRPTFLDYLQSGSIDISLSVAIDFSASNDMAKPNSLHSIDETDPSSMNTYEEAIRSVGEILLHYDSIKKVPVYGFGAKVADTINVTGESNFAGVDVSHCFPLNMNWENPELSSINDIITTYRELVRPIPNKMEPAKEGVLDAPEGASPNCAVPVRPNLQFSHPTKFFHVIDEVGRRIRESLEAQAALAWRPLMESDAVPSPQRDYCYHKHSILLIITDGQISDFNETFDEIKSISRDLPLSIVIVGVGNGPFDQMRLLDADDAVKDRLAHGWHDIVQFVEFQKYARLGGRVARQVLLAQEVLAEIPGQFLRYVQSHGIGLPAVPNLADEQSCLENVFAARNGNHDDLPSYHRATSLCWA